MSRQIDEERQDIFEFQFHILKLRPAWLETDFEYTFLRAINQIFPKVCEAPYFYILNTTFLDAILP